eukprot:GHUV01013838.1.p1 GENE.GHUV01013838.1~~GHUV01013838.1.p1  ORF type:complete len:497 (+),score=171.69 GHUV01013838.1:611-2101(+)
MLLQAQSHTVQARSVATRALQPVARSALSSSVLKVHTAQASLLPHHAGSSVSSSSHSSRCSSSWSPRAAVTTSAAAEAAAAATAEQQAAVEGEWSVLNFYHLVDIADPDEMLARHKQYIADHDLHSVCGRIYISKQGINCQGGGLKTHTQQYVSWVASQPEFQGLFHTLWPADGPMFPKLRLKLKPSLISLAGGMEAIPCTNPDMRATPLDPAAWRHKLAKADASKRVVVMDLRNDYEWDAGHFDWAPRPDEEVFAETPAGGGPDELPSPLKGTDPENTEVMMYCTGGIRCDVYSALLHQKGYKNLYTLHGGIQNYLREEGNEHWKGSLFVFDGRMAINPALEGQLPEGAGLPAAVPCSMCGGKASLPHVNCANIDCNELFIACNECKKQYHGCCCEECQAAPRLLRPIKINGGNYGNWGNYADVDTLGPVMASARNHEGRVARRARRREALQAKRESLMAERQELKAAMKAAMRAAEEAAQQEAEQTTKAAALVA